MRFFSTSRLGIKLVLLLSAVVCSTVFVVIYLSQPTFVSTLNNRTMDAVMTFVPVRPASGAVIIVDIDEKSLDHYGQWPWPRSLLAQLFDSIATSGAGSIGLDMILAEPGRDSAGVPGTPLAPQYPALSGSTVELSASDRLLAKTLANGPYVLGYAFSFRNDRMPRQVCNLHPPGVILINMNLSPTPFFSAKGVTCNLPYFSNAVNRSGFLNATPDADGILRRMPMLISFADDVFPSLTLAMLMRYEKNAQMAISRTTTGRIDFKAGKRTVPLDDHGNLTVRFCNPADAIRRVSASSVLRGEVSDEFKNKIVLVGFSATGLEPTYQTTAGLRMPLEIHAQALENLLCGDQVVRVTSFLVWEVIAGVAVAAAVALVVALRQIVSSGAICATLLAGLWLGTILVFRGTQSLFSPLLPTVLVVVNYPVLTIVKSWLALAEKQRQLQEINLSQEQRIAAAVSELRQKDQILVQQGRQAAMGEMLNNIAHQWRQPLNVLALIVQELQFTYGSEAFNKQSLSAAVAKAMLQIRHMSQTIEDFRNYFKPDKTKSHFRVSQAIARTLALVEANMKSMDIAVEVTEKQDPEIFGYPNEYSQVLLNILLNSRDAFELSATKLRRSIVITVDKVDGTSVVTITDNAGGIPEEVIAKIFDPYFTTKGPTKGTGIGLYMAKTIIENNMSGKITARNTGDGSEFRIEV